MILFIMRTVTLRLLYHNRLLKNSRTRIAICSLSFGSEHLDNQMSFPVADKGLRLSDNPQALPYDLSALDGSTPGCCRQEHPANQGQSPAYNLRLQPGACLASPNSPPG